MGAMDALDARGWWKSVCSRCVGLWHTEWAIRHAAGRGLGEGLVGRRPSEYDRWCGSANSVLRGGFVVIRTPTGV
jgi:hypothetical protein